MLGNRIFLSSFLPIVRFGVPLQLSIHDLYDLYQNVLCRSGWGKVVALREIKDVENVFKLFDGGDIDGRGNLDKNTLMREIDYDVHNILPQSMRDFINTYSSIEEKRLHFDKAFDRYLCDMNVKFDGFLGWYFGFERNIRFYIARYRYGRVGIENALDGYSDGHCVYTQYEQTDLYEALKSSCGDPVAEHGQIILYKLNCVVDKSYDLCKWSLDYLLAYLVSAWLVQDSCDPNVDAGSRVLNVILGEGD